jgi:hypothetical protein
MLRRLLRNEGCAPAYGGKSKPAKLPKKKDEGEDEDEDAAPPVRAAVPTEGGARQRQGPGQTPAAPRLPSRRVVVHSFALCMARIAR